MKGLLVYLSLGEPLFLLLTAFESSSSSNDAKFNLEQTEKVVFLFLPIEDERPK